MPKQTITFLTLALTIALSSCAPKKNPVKPMVLAMPEARRTSSCQSSGGLPDSLCTPGAIRTTDVQSICHGGSTKQYRPSTSYTNKLKAQQISEYGYADTSLSDYEE